MSLSDIFTQQVHRQFRFVVDDFGFHETSAIPYLVNGEYLYRYESDGWFIEPMYSTWDNEINIRIGTVTEGPFSFHMFLGIVNPKSYYQLGYSIAKSKEDVKSLLTLYSDALCTDGLPILCKDQATIERLKLATISGAGLCPPYYKQPPGQKITSQFV